MNSGIYIINAAIALITIWIIYKYINIFLIKNDKKSFISSLLWICFYLFQVYVESNKGDINLWMLIPNILFIFFIGVTGFKGSLLNKLFFSFVLYVVWMLIESIIAIVLQTMMIRELEFELLGSVISKIVVIGFISFLKVREGHRKKRNIDFQYLFKLLLISASSIFIAYDLFLFYIENTENQTFTPISFALLLIVNITIFEIYEKLLDSTELEKENAVYLQQIGNLSEYTEERKKQREDFAVAQHNLINQYIGIKSNIVNGQLEQALSTMDELLQECSVNMEECVNSGNELVDAIVNNKSVIAQRNQIDFRIRHFMIPSELPILQKDLCIVLGNTLDNAIEAARECVKEKYVELSVGIKKGTFVIVVKNSFESELKHDKQGNLLTTKEKKDGHGYGMKSVRKALDHCEGDLQIKTNENQFVLTVIINM